MAYTIKAFETDKGLAVYDYESLANKPDITGIEQEFIVDLVSSFTDTVNKGADYKGYYNGQKIAVDLPSGTNYDVLIETDAFTKADLYFTTNGSNYLLLVSDFPVNQRTTLKSGGALTGLTLFARAANVTQGGEFTFKVILPNKDGIKYQVSHLKVGDRGDGILNLNPKNEMLPLLLSARVSSGLGNANSTNRKKCFTIAHFSDIHADGENMKRIVEFCEEYADYIDEIVCTGDMARDNATAGGVAEDYSWWGESGGDKVLAVIGNHDTNVVTNGVSDWRGFGMVNTYNKYFAPYIANWGVTQPPDAATGGKCYYYKDYSDYGIRVIVLDCMYYNTVQNSWFADTLADAKSKGYGVIAMAHGLGKSGDTIACNFSSLTAKAGMVIVDTPEYIFGANVHVRIDEFIEAGGTFICFLGGHFHDDIIGMVKDTAHPQLFILADCAASDASSENRAYLKGTRAQDSFNIVSIDTKLKLVKMLKVGCQHDVYMRKKGSVCYNYATKQLVYNN